MSRTLVTALVALGVTSACAIPRRQHDVIDRYTAATCLPLVAESRVKPPVREWDTTVRSSNGNEVVIVGYQAVSGRIEARDKRTGQTHIVASAGDYVYPADVRTSSDLARVYVKADGLGAGIWQETWLFEYDLTQFKQLNKVRVDPSVMPPECPGGPPREQP